MVSVLHKELRIQSGKSQIQEVGGHAAEDQKQIRTSSSFQLVNKLSQISPHQVLIDFKIQSIIH